MTRRKLLELTGAWISTKAAAGMLGTILTVASYACTTLVQFINAAPSHDAKMLRPSRLALDDGGCGSFYTFSTTRTCPP